MATTTNPREEVTAMPEQPKTEPKVKIVLDVDSFTAKRGDELTTDKATADRLVADGLAHVKK